jgi:hypothetical protein
MRMKFFLSVLALVIGLNILAWALSAPRAKTFPTALDFGGGVITIGAVPPLSLPAGSAGAILP